MKIVTGLFTPEDGIVAIRKLIKQGFNREELSMMSSATQMPEYLEGEAEKSAASGAVIGAASGGVIGALGSVITSTFPGFENMIVSGLMATSVGTVVGGYLGSLYSVRAESQEEIDIHEALESGDILVVVRTDESKSESAKSILTANNGQHVESHTIPAEKVK
jgi:hypothetical protein